VRVSHSARYALSVCAGVAMLAGCNASQVGIGGAPARADAGRPDAKHGYAIIHTFSGDDGAYPQAALLALSGKLYGTTDGGGGRYNDGTVFELSTTGSEQIVHSFTGGTDGAKVDTGLVALNGSIYGTTQGGGANKKGIVFEINGSSNESVLHSFGVGTDGTHPRSGLVAYNGSLYGTTYFGGPGNGGTAFRINLAGAERVVASFGRYSTFGAHPDGTLVHADKKLYGLTSGGGVYDGGVAFSLSTSGKERLFHSFGKGGDGDDPDNAALLHFNRAFYGTTCYGGAHGQGTVFRLAAGNESVLYSFGATSRDGSCPSAGLVEYQGSFYGTTFGGGSTKNGTVFVVNSLGAEAILHSFAAGQDGAFPAAPLTEMNGVLYGTTSFGGDGFGTVFKVRP